jgi:hypothetical protein
MIFFPEETLELAIKGARKLHQDMWMLTEIDALSVRRLLYYELPLSAQVH